MSLLILVVLLRGLFVLLQLGRCHIIQSRIILFAPLFYLVIGSRCPVCPGVLSTIVVCSSDLFKISDASIVSRISSMLFSGYLPSLFFLWSYIYPHMSWFLIFNVTPCSSHSYCCIVISFVADCGTEEMGFMTICCNGTLLDRHHFAKCCGNKVYYLKNHLKCVDGEVVFEFQ